MTCKDCIHYDICATFNTNIPELYEGIERGCEGFQNKVDIQEVKRGKWIFKGVHVSGFAFKCSICGRYMFAYEEQCKTAEDLIKNFPFCHCGARMDGDKR